MAGQISQFTKLRSLTYWLRIIGVVAILVFVTGCMSGSGDSGGNSGGDAGGDTSGTPGGTSGGDTGGGDTGGGTGGGDTGGGTGGGTGGDTGGGGTGGGSVTIYGTFANLYTNDTNVNLNVVSCLDPASGGKLFSSVTFRSVNQVNNNVDAAITLTPTAAYLSQFDQIFITVTGVFQSDGSFNGSLSTIYSLNGVIVNQSTGNVIINVIGNIISLDFTVDSLASACGLTGGMFLTEMSDPGGSGGDTGGGTGGGGGVKPVAIIVVGTGGGDTGGGTGGGDTGGGTGGGTGFIGTHIDVFGQFGSLEMISTDYPEDNGSFEMTRSVLATIPGFEAYAWTNAVEEININVFFGGDDVNPNRTTLNSSNGRSYFCFCFPTVDLVNNEVTFSNMVLETGSNIPPETITINGVVSIARNN